MSYIKVSVHDFSDFVIVSNAKPCTDQLEGFKLGARLKPALYCARQAELRLSVRQNGVLSGKGVVLVSVPQRKSVFYSAATVSTKGWEDSPQVNDRFELKTLMSEVCTKN
jgi:hypothetical protein